MSVVPPVTASAAIAVRPARPENTGNEHGCSRDIGISALLGSGAREIAIDREDHQRDVSGRDQAEHHARPEGLDDPACQQWRDDGASGVKEDE